MRGTFGQIWCRLASDEWPDDPEAVARAGSVSWKNSAIEAGTLARSISDSIANKVKVERDMVMVIHLYQARNQGGVHGVRSHPPSGPKGPHFDTQHSS